MHLGLGNFIPSKQAGLRYSGNDFWPQNTWSLVKIRKKVEFLNSL